MRASDRRQGERQRHPPQPWFKPFLHPLRFSVPLANEGPLGLKSGFGFLPLVVENRNRTMTSAIIIILCQCDRHFQDHSVTLLCYSKRMLPTQLHNPCSLCCFLLSVSRLRTDGHKDSSLTQPRGEEKGALSCQANSPKAQPLGRTPSIWSVGL